ncbi:MAG TPA: hybrid sensor histidine kinase/response regulator [Polyangiaceae bacterium]
MAPPPDQAPSPPLSVGLRKQLLLVDDEPVNLDLLEMCLEPLGHALVRATGGHEALEACVRRPIDLVLLDVMMPDLDGFAVLQALRAGERTRHLPVILITAATDRERRLRGMELGATDFVEKPFDRLELAARIRTLLELKDATDLVFRRNGELERLQREQRDLTSFVVHDMKNSMAVIASNVGWLEEELRASASSEILEALGDAREASTRLTDMMSELLAIARLEEPGRPALSDDPIALADLVEEAVRARAKDLARDAIVVQTELDPETVLRGDRSILRRVLDNLLDNALRFTPPGGRIGFCMERGAVQVELSVSNSGPPIPESQRLLVFEKFGSGGRRTKNNHGLGLHFCRLAIEAHGGHIEVTESEPWPTRFRIFLPLPGPTT